MRTYTIQHKRRGNLETVKARSPAHVWRLVCQHGGEPTHYRMMNISTVGNRTCSAS